jgi:hypothetical protein
MRSVTAAALLLALAFEDEVQKLFPHLVRVGISEVISHYNSCRYRTLLPAIPTDREKWHISIHRSASHGEGMQY